eukprot:432755-Prymnesium_polylepis.1
MRGGMRGWDDDEPPAESVKQQGDGTRASRWSAAEQQGDTSVGTARQDDGLLGPAPPDEWLSVTTPSDVDIPVALSTHIVAKELLAPLLARLVYAVGCLRAAGSDAHKPAEAVGVAEAAAEVAEAAPEPSAGGEEL